MGKRRILVHYLCLCFNRKFLLKARPNHWKLGHIHPKSLTFLLGTRRTFTFLFIGAQTSGIGWREEQNAFGAGARLPKDQSAAWDQPTR